MRLALFVVVSASVSLAGCGSITALNVDAGSSGTGGSQTGSGGTGGGAGGPGGDGGGSGGGMGGGVGSGGSGGSDNMLPCPQRTPTSGTACLRDGLMCQYGDDPRGDHCTTLATCSGNRWMVTNPNPMSCPPLTDGGMCMPGDSGQTCKPSDAACKMPDGRWCHCTNCVDYPVHRCLGEDTWHCQTASTVAGCPAAPPKIGGACLRESATCEYGCGYTIRKCERGIWVPAGESPCPISTRKAKQNIQYLSPAEIHAVADDILKVKLALYEYRDRPFAGRKHLGFIIEDSPGIAAVDRDHDMVDLYGYTSMLLAATQQQAQEIDQLKLQLRTLQRDVANLTRRKGR
ncbi:MAG TPA: hypothetical protein VFH73_11060 [Polyangia bacterium]|nr:hypothetical protein [Polyangia bacterium]